MTIPVHRDRIALNAIQWINIKADPDDPESEDLWRYADPAFRADYPGVLDQIRDAGFGAVMMEVLATQTLQDFARMIEASGLALAPGYASIPVPSDHSVLLPPGTGERMHWFDGIRRKAEESNWSGLSTVFLAPEVSWEPGFVRTRDAVAVGAGFRQDRLDEQIEFLGEAAEVLRAEGVRAGLHNHVGTWIETQHEYEHVLRAIDASRLGASFDIGHLEWAGIEAKQAIADWADRVQDLHLKDLDLDLARRSREEGMGYERATDLGLYREPGLGQIDLVDTLSALPDGFGGWIIIEVDRASMDPVQSAQYTARWVADVTAG